MKQKKMSAISRRAFVKGAAAASVFTIVPRHVLGQGFTPPSETVVLASIGAGNRAGADISACANAGARIVALCDVDDSRAEKMFQKYPDVPKYKDFRVMLDKEAKNVDGVIVGTPDHTHAVAALDVIGRGKNLYCEKPLAHSIYEVRRLRRAAKKAGIVARLGNQGHSVEHIRVFCEWIWDGAIGDVREVHAQCRSDYSEIEDLGKLKETYSIPETLDWNLWQGPVPERDYNPLFLPGNWRRWTRYGTGVIGDWVCHVVDPVFWALELGAPTAIVAEAPGYDPALHGETFPHGTKVYYTFPAKGKRPEVKLVWYDGNQKIAPPEELEPGRKIPEIGALVVGDKGKIMYGSHGASSCIIIPQEKMLAYERPTPTLQRVKDHHGEWLDAIKGNPCENPSEFEYGAPLTEIALLGAIALRLKGTELAWDGKEGRFTNSDEANTFIKPEFRNGWKLV